MIFFFNFDSFSKIVQFWLNLTATSKYLLHKNIFFFSNNLEGTKLDLGITVVWLSLQSGILRCPCTAASFSYTGSKMFVLSSGFLNHSNGAEWIHDFEDLCKYGNIRQAKRVSRDNPSHPWNRQTNTTVDTTSEIISPIWNKDATVFQSWQFWKLFFLLSCMFTPFISCLEERKLVTKKKEKRETYTHDKGAHGKFKVI